MKRLDATTATHPRRGQGERLVGRDLKRQAKDRKLYEPGQYAARIIPAAGGVVGILSLVDAYGRAVLITCVKEHGEEWKAERAASADAVVPGATWDHPFELSEKQIHTLRQAEREAVAEA